MGTDVNVSETRGLKSTYGVPDAGAFDLWAARRFIIAERVLAGADTALGHRCSNMIELIENYTMADNPTQVSAIKIRLFQTVQEIAEIKGRKALAPPLKMLEEV